MDGVIKELCTAQEYADLAAKALWDLGVRPHFGDGGAPVMGRWVARHARHFSSVARIQGLIAIEDSLRGPMKILHRSHGAFATCGSADFALPDGVWERAVGQYQGIKVRYVMGYEPTTDHAKEWFYVSFGFSPEDMGIPVEQWPAPYVGPLDAERERA